MQLKSLILLGKALKTVDVLEKMSNFDAIPLLEPLPVIPDDITKNLSTDSKTAWKVLQAVTTGNLPDEFAALKIGVMCHSR